MSIEELLKERDPGHPSSSIFNMLENLLDDSFRSNQFPKHPIGTTYTPS